MNGVSNKETWFLKGFVNTLFFSKIKGDAAGVWAMFLCFELPLNSKSDFITGDSFDSDFYSFRASVEHKGLMLTKGLDGVVSSLIFGLGFEIEHFAIC